MKRHAFSLILCCLFTAFLSANNTDNGRQLIGEFLSADWPTVLAAKEKIESAGKDYIDDLLSAMNDCRIQKLQNTGDLIYPGAEKYFGHGQIIDYDIDDICVRAGWLLEDLTFRNFGFTGIHLPDNELAGFIRNNFPEYYNDPVNRASLDELTVPGERKLIRTLSIEKARKWWNSASSGWNRLDALREALNSQDDKCQVKALFYLRNGNTLCKGLTEKYYKSNLENTVKKLSRVKQGRVSEHAKLIMLDSDFDWLSIKPVE